MPFSRRSFLCGAVGIGVTCDCASAQVEKVKQQVGNCLDEALGGQFAEDAGPVTATMTETELAALSERVNEMATRVADAFDFRTAGFSPALTLTQNPLRIGQVLPDRPANATGFPTVRLSAQFVRDELRANRGRSVYGFLAHELSHVVQVQRGYWTTYRNGDRALLELQADFLAGWALGRDRAYPFDEEDIAVFAEQLYLSGDFEFSSSQHHGIPSQRYVMMMRGYLRRNARSASTIGIAAELAMQEAHALWRTESVELRRAP